MKTIILYIIIVAVCMAVAVVNARLMLHAYDDLHQISEDIGAIRRALDPHPFSVGQEAPLMREHVMLREDTARQQPEVTLL